MKFNDEITLNIAKAVSDVMEGKAKKEEVKYPHKMYHPETGEEVEVKDKAGHDKYSKLGYTHTPKEVAQPKQKGEKEFKSIHDIEVSGEAPDGKVKKAKKGDYYKEETNIKENKEQLKKQIDQARAKVAQLQRFKQNATNRNQARKMQQKVWDAQDRLEKLRDKYEKAEDYKSEEATPTAPAKEESEKQKKYQAFFNKALKKFGVKSPSELDDEKKKEFFDYVDANYEADNETDESVKEETQLDEIIGARIPDAGKDSSGIRKAVGKDGGSDGGMDNKEKVGYNALKAIAQKMYKAMDDEENANNEEEQERAIDAVQKYRAEFQSKAKFYKDATAKKAKADAKKG